MTEPPAPEPTTQTSAVRTASVPDTRSIGMTFGACSGDGGGVTGPGKPMTSHAGLRSSSSKAPKNWPKTMVLSCLSARRPVGTSSPARRRRSVRASSEASANPSAASSSSRPRTAPATWGGRPGTAAATLAGMSRSEAPRRR